MPVELRNLEELDPEIVAQNLFEAVSRVQEDNPHLDLRMGVFFSLVVYYHAVLATQLQANVADYLAARSLKAIEADPTLAQPDLVDDVFSNFGITRKPGSKATGQVTILLSRDINTVIAQGAVFEATGGLRFVTEDVFTAKLGTDHIILDTDRVLTQTPEGNWAFTIEVVAEAEGAESQLKKDSILAPLVEPNFYVTSYASSDFLGGTSAETNSDMLTKQQLGYAGKAMSNRTQMQAMLRDIEAFARIIGMSIVGYGDPEQLRDQHTIFPVSLGGRVDWYIRSQQQIYRQAITKEATYIEANAGGYGVWQFTMTKEDSPGFYELVNIRLENAEEVVGGFAIESETRTIDMTGTGFIPDIDAAGLVEGIYTAYQTAVVRFVDTVTPTSGLAVGDKQNYTLESRCLPLIGEIQAHVNHRDVRHHGADCLVKAPIPAFTTINFTIYKQSGETDPDTGAIKDAICEAVNTVGFIGRLYASRLSDTIHAYLTNATSVSAIDMHARIRRPDGTATYLRSAEVLTVPDDPGSMVSPRTVQFFISPEDVGIDIVTAIPQDQ
jgi:hypothetical protein